MKSRVAVSLFSLLFSHMLLSQEIKEYDINHTGTAIITIDGILDESVWETAPATDNFVIYSTGAPGYLSMYGRMLWDDNNLYVAMETDDPDMVAIYTEQDDHFYKEDDLVELFIDPDGNGVNYLEIGLSPRSTNYDYIIIDPVNWQDDLDWDCDGLEGVAAVNGTINDDSDTDISWTAELKIPFASMDYPGFGLSLPVTEGNSWRMNLYRIDYDHTTMEWEPNEEYAWSMIGPLQTCPGAFHTPERFGRVTFVKESTRLSPAGQNNRKAHGPVSITMISPQLFALHNTGKEITRVSLCDLSGQALFRTSIKGLGHVLWDTQNIAPGCYICIKHTNHGEYMTRVTVVSK